MDEVVERLAVVHSGLVVLMGLPEHLGADLVELADTPFVFTGRMLLLMQMLVLIGALTGMLVEQIVIFQENRFEFFHSGSLVGVASFHIR